MDERGAGGEGKLRGKLSAQTKWYLDAGVSELVAHVELEDLVVVAERWEGDRAFDSITWP